MPTPFLCSNCTKPTMNNSCICNDCELAYIGGAKDILANVMELEDRVAWLEDGLKQIAGGYSEYAWGEEAQAILDGEPTTADEYNKEFKYWTDVGVYKSNSFIGLLWEIFRHRFYHLIHDKQWRD